MLIILITFNQSLSDIKVYLKIYRLFTSYVDDLLFTFQNIFEKFDELERKFPNFIELKLLWTSWKF